jgi:adenine-specific DNA-methyltransferase
MAHQTRLELTWIGKNERPRLEPRILLEDSALSYHAPQRLTNHDIFDNHLIQGDNLLGLKALEQEFSGRVKCIYIDPPYNTGSAFEHYDDGLEHSLWLALIRERLEILHRLLANDGSIWVHLDDNEVHYCKVLADEVFGRKNFMANVVWQKRTSPDMRVMLGAGHDHILVYAKDLQSVSLNRLPKTPEQLAQFRNPDDDPRGPWVSSDYTAQGYRPNQMYTIMTPGGREYTPPKGVCWKNVEPVFLSLVADNRIWFGRDGRGMPRRRTFLSETDGNQSWTWWTNEDAGHTQEAKKESIALFGDKAFDTPKPERLLHRILSLATRPGDLVLDSFAGSGTTGAVAHKMGRRWIMVELGDHCLTHALSRMKRVIDGADPGGSTEACGWKGGGGFRFLKLAPSLLEKDKWGNWIVSRNYHPEMLAEAMCKLEGFRYAPDPDVFWIHGGSTERDFIYVTTQTLSREQLRFISDQVGSERSLLITCAAFRAKKDEFPNLTVKKIPHAVLGRCEWGRDDYSLNVEALPPVQVVEEARDVASASGSFKAQGAKATRGRRRKKASSMQDLPLFAGVDNQGNRR